MCSTICFRMGLKAALWTPKPDLHSKGKRVFVSSFLSELCQKAASPCCSGGFMSVPCCRHHWLWGNISDLIVPGGWEVRWGESSHPQGYYTTDVAQNGGACASAVQRNSYEKSVIRVCHNQQAFILPSVCWNTYCAFIKGWNAQTCQLQIAAFLT